ncbi:hypothetical protein HZH68_007237 [Vespula germanica]|uniref:Uncharacterized protein n=1 Tax=Vespula germanica TaxID=30212 RepID=A0A834N9R5_VESGE|nr:hypothetical protein HZH68_007237 [Vespula germanica]
MPTFLHLQIGDRSGSKENTGRGWLFKGLRATGNNESSNLQVMSRSLRVLLSLLAKRSFAFVTREGLCSGAALERAGDLNDIALTEVDLIARTMARVIITCLSHSHSLNISTIYIVYAHICYCNKVMYMTVLLINENRHLIPTGNEVYVESILDGNPLRNEDRSFELHQTNSGSGAV